MIISYNISKELLIIKLKVMFVGAVSQLVICGLCGFSRDIQLENEIEGFGCMKLFKMIAFWSYFI